MGENLATSFDIVSRKSMKSSRRSRFLRVAFFVGIGLLISWSYIPACLACLPQVVLGQPVEKKKNFFSKVRFSSKFLLASAALTIIASLAYALAYSNDELKFANDYIALLLSKCEKWGPLTE